eukprot:CAMPEP_0170604150 /NCGR_PEP_ID=MMETSP0224-20130122/19273_1 /TAXON_ID=285029 /ORGANISM="Togula jolla, Strain CCCM 725" /LENGTH=343 /DNA_ID=CAMNT_0010929041 /DNA_START=92 /DNA_END=1124 /DNA_ORIENTATION=+
MALLGRPQGAKRRHHQRGLLAKATPVLVLACLTLVLLQASDAFVAVSPAGGHAGRVGSMRAWQSAPAAIAAVGQPRELASYGSLAAILCTAVALAARHSHCRGIAAAAAPRRAVLCLRADLPGTTDAPCSERAITEVAPSSVAVQLPAASSGIEALSALPPPAPKQAPAEPVYATVAAAATAPMQQPVRAVASPPASWAELASALPGQPGRAVVPRRRSAPPGDVVARGSKIFRQSSPEQRPSIPVVFERRSRPACVLLRTSGTAAASAKAGLRHPAKAQAPQTTVVFKQKTENDFNNHEHKWYQRLKSSGCTPDREQAQTMTTSKESWFFVCFSYWVEGAAV